MATDSKQVLVALDYPDQAQATAMAQRLDPARCRLKVGKELFTRSGPAIVETLQSRGFDVFDFGVAGLNQRIEKSLAARKFIQVQDEIWYHGRPVMVTRNDHGLGLYNGDIGICMRDDTEEEPRLKVFFELPDGSVKSVLPSRVPEHETAYAMTIHKSQGSEFDYTLMILPPDFSPILTRELIYTGITRAKKRLALYAELNVLKRGIKVKTTRASGLVQRLTN